jgi:hypothetical protein
MCALVSSLSRYLAVSDGEMFKEINFREYEASSTEEV